MNWPPIPWGLRVPIWKINFCSGVLRLSVFPWCRERPQTDICCLEWFGRLKCLATGLDAFSSSFSTSRRCSRNRSPSRLPVFLLTKNNTTSSRGFRASQRFNLHFWRHFDVIGSIICSGLHFWRHWFNIWSTAAGYLTIIRLRLSESRRIFPETKSRGIFAVIHWAWGE